MTRGFIQIAGFTFGKATSFFDFVSTAAVAYNAGMLHSSDTGDAGQIVAAYTAQFGNGLSSTISFEQTRRAATVDLNAATARSALASLAGATCNNLARLARVGTDLQRRHAGHRRQHPHRPGLGLGPDLGAAHDLSAGYFGAVPGLNARRAVIRATRGAGPSAPVCG